MWGAEGAADRASGTPQPSPIPRSPERVGITRDGKLTAVLVSVEDLEALEEFEMAEDVAAYRAAEADDDGTRVSLDEFRDDPGE
ncbi:MAG: hypothetical protein ACRCY8_19925 [Dermatophilaceae bacterium]